MLSHDDFLGYMSYHQNLDDIVEMCLEEARNGSESINLMTDYDLSASDIKYIQNEVSKRL